MITPEQKLLDPLCSQKGAWGLVNGQLAMFSGDTIIKYVPMTFNLTPDVMPTGGPNQGRIYQPAPKKGRQRRMAKQASKGSKKGKKGKRND